VWVMVVRQRSDTTAALRARHAGRSGHAENIESFPALCAATLALPFAAGWAVGGTWRAAVLALVWAGLVRIFLLQHVTWSVNSLSLCHLLGNRPFTTRRFDRATNL
jgi:stearoyl-CoA desaturase (delta-9 desaturase)